MEAENRQFNFHNIVAASASCDASFANNFFHDEYLYHSTNSDISPLPNVDLKFFLNKKIPALHTHYRHKLFANMDFDLNLSDHEVDISIYGNKVAVPNPHITDTSTPVAILLLERGQINKPELVELKEKASTVDELIYMNFYEARHLIALMKKTGKYTEHWFKKWYSLERKRLRLILDSIPVYKFVLPYYSDKAKQSQELIQSINPFVKNSMVN